MLFGPRLAVAALGLVATQSSAGPIGNTGVVGARELARLSQRDAANMSSSDDDWSLANHLGNLAPYHVPEGSNYSLTLPDTCVIDQVSLMQRHGSRFPLASELVYITNVSKLFDANPKLLANLTGKYEFLKTWKPELGANDLTAPGRLELFSHGVTFNLSYPELSTDVMLAGGQDRVIESAEWFRMGYYGRDYANRSTLNIISEDDDTYSYITSTGNCSLWEYSYGLVAVNAWNAVYLPPIVNRFDQILPGFNFTQNNIHGMLYACAYETAAFGSTPWCALFEHDEIEAFEYELDLLMDYAFGYSLPYGLGPVLGSIYVKTLLGRLDGSAGNTSMWLEFGHDTTIDLILTALGLAKDTPNLPATGPVNPKRAWRTSSQVPFAAKMVTERITCTTGSANATETWVRLLLNNAPFPITTCGSKMNISTGACPLDTFAAINAASVNITHDDYDRVCNNTGTVMKM